MTFSEWSGTRAFAPFADAGKNPEGTSSFFSEFDCQNQVFFIALNLLLKQVDRAMYADRRSSGAFGRAC
jgi:hypothetical protein